MTSAGAKACERKGTRNLIVFGGRYGGRKETVAAITSNLT
jgi:hypothetical protein